MKNRFLFPIFVLFLTSFTGFKSEQLTYERVRIAYAQKESSASKLFTSKGLSLNQSVIYIRVFKQESVLELWARSKNDSVYSLIKEYEICSSSGGLGPKRKQGDGQVPEGHYYINRFNPYSNFYLSLGSATPMLRT